MRLIDADKLKSEMYHNAFEIDTDLQKWDSGCWIRYKMFENVIENQPTVKAIPIEWLKKKAQEFAERYWSKQDDHKKLILPMIDCPIVIEQMIKEWGYENATD